jgi:hypothetical protein
MLSGALLFGGIRIVLDPAYLLAYTHGGVRFHAYAILAALFLPLALLPVVRLSRRRWAPLGVLAVAILIGLAGEVVARVGFAIVQQVSVIGEELGLAGILVVVLLFGIVVWRGIRAAFSAPDPFGAYLALGLTSLLGVQALANMLVAMGLLPTKGLCLPFLSYGGTSLVLSLGAAGILLAISSGRGGYLRPQRASR